MVDDILTIEEVAKYLRVSERTVYDWAQKGEIPSGKIGTVWRFKRSDIERWINERLSSNSKFPHGNRTVQVKNILSPERIVFVERLTKRDALVELADNLSKAPQIKNSKELVTEVLKREDLMSTAIGMGIAIPHVRLSSVTDLVMSVGLCKNPISDFYAMDDIPVRIIFMIAAAYNQHAYYLQTLSFFSTRMKNKKLRDSLLYAENAETVYALLSGT